MVEHVMKTNENGPRCPWGHRSIIWPSLDYHWTIMGHHWPMVGSAHRLGSQWLANTTRFRPMIESEESAGHSRYKLASARRWYTMHVDRFAPCTSCQTCKSICRHSRWWEIYNRMIKIMSMQICLKASLYVMCISSLYLCDTENLSLHSTHYRCALCSAYKHHALVR